MTTYTQDTGLSGATLDESEQYYKTMPTTLRVVCDLATGFDEFWGVILPSGNVDFDNFDDCETLQDVELRVKRLLKR